MCTERCEYGEIKKKTSSIKCAKSKRKASINTYRVYRQTIHQDYKKRDQVSFHEWVFSRSIHCTLVWQIQNVNEMTEGKITHPHQSLTNTTRETHRYELKLLVAFSICSRVRFLHNTMFSKTNKQTATAAAAKTTAKMIGFMQFPHCSVCKILSFIFIFIFASLENYSAFCSWINCVGYARVNLWRLTIYHFFFSCIWIMTLSLLLPSHTLTYCVSFYYSVIFSPVFSSLQWISCSFLFLFPVLCCFYVVVVGFFLLNDHFISFVG